VLRGHGEKFFLRLGRTAMLNKVTPRFKYFFCLHATRRSPPGADAEAHDCRTERAHVAVGSRLRWRATSVAKENAARSGCPSHLGSSRQRAARSAWRGSGESLAIELMVRANLLLRRAKELGWSTRSSPLTRSGSRCVVRQAVLPPHKASKAVGLISGPCNSGAEVPFESALAIERELQQQSSRARMPRKAIAAYNEKRVAEFKGK